MVPDATTLSAVVHRAWVARKSPVVFGMEVSAVPSCATDLCGVLLDAAAVSPVPSKRFYEYLSHVVVCKIVPASTLWSAFKTHQAVTAQKPQHLQALLAVALPLCDACDLGQEEPMAFATARCHAFTALVQLAADCAKLVVDKTLSSTSSVHASNLGVCLQLVLGFLSSRASLNLLHVTDESDAVVDAVAKSVEQLQHSQDLLLAPSGSQSLPTAVTEYLQPTLARVKGWTEAWRVRAHIQAVALDCWPRDAGPDPSPRLLAQFEASRWVRLRDWARFQGQPKNENKTTGRNPPRCLSGLPLAAGGTAERCGTRCHNLAEHIRRHRSTALQPSLRCGSGQLCTGPWPQSCPKPLVEFSCLRGYHSLPALWTTADLPSQKYKRRRRRSRRRTIAWPPV
eukprot:m.82421 g.82421  ORF g.82421 m.82421 type:complete len:397 (+) comp14727_c0_seq5:118-1308(+)